MEVEKRSMIIRAEIGKLAAVIISAVVGMVAMGLVMGPATPLLEASGSSTTSVDRAQLDRGRLRVEGETQPNAVIFIVHHRDLIAVGTANDGGSFRIEAEGATSPSCVDGDNQVRAVIVRLPREVLFQEVVTLDPCNHS